MTDQSGLQPSEGEGKTTLYRPDAEGGLEAAPPQGDYREDLRSRRWNAAPLENPEVEKTDGRIVVAAIVLLSVITFVVLVVGYGTGVWSLPGQVLSGARTSRSHVVWDWNGTLLLVTTGSTSRDSLEATGAPVVDTQLEAARVVVDA